MRKTKSTIVASHQLEHVTGDNVEVYEQELVKRLKASSEKAFDEIYRRYAGRLYAFCLQYGKCHEDAEEIVEDVFIRLWDSRNSIRQTSSIKPLLFTIARNHLINAYRRTLNSPEFAAYVELYGAMADDDASAKVEYDEFVKRLHEGISLLPATQQQVVKLSKLEGLDNQEIACQLGLSYQTVRNQLSLALKTLRQRLLPISPLLCLLFL